ncbi:MAG TPA: ABC transporter substrate-binding protein [Alphaproteobacteria bacterium]|nr:ABC transporter substrate-binding protein [Alphaproteobacteria bacterium]
MIHYGKTGIGRARGVAVAALAMLGALAIAPVAPGQAHAAELKVWRHGIIQAKSDAGIIMMVTQGFAQKEGLKLEISQFKADVIGLKALIAGEVDSYEGGPGGAMIAASRGADVRVIGCHWPGLPHGIFVRANIHSAKDLVGKTIAISSPGAMPDMLARALLERDGVSPDQVKFANLGGDADRFKALAAGVVAAAVVSNEYTPIATKEGLKLLVPGRELLPNYMRVCIMTSGKVLREKHDLAVRFLAAEMKALHFAMTHRDATLALTREITGVKPDDPRPAFIYDDALRTHAVDPTLAIPRAKFAWLQAQSIKSGEQPKPVDLSTFLDDSVRREALALIAK